MSNAKTKKQKLTVILLCISILLMLLSSIGASLIQTDFGKVEVTEFKIPTNNGRWISGTLFKPKYASAESPVPLVVSCHGYLNNSKMQDINAIELSRRGVAVITYDAYFHGKSSSSNADIMTSTMTDGIGMVSVVDYAYDELDYIDKEHIGILGHSMGGMAVWTTLMYYQTQEINKVQAGMPMGFLMFSNDETFQMIDANVGIDYAKYDEGGYANAEGTGILTPSSPEVLAAINSIYPEEKKLTSAEIGKYYGSAADRTLRVVYNPSEIHPGMHFSSESVSYVVDFFSACFDLSPSIPSTNQVWFLKELFNLLGVIGIFLSILPITLLLLQIPVFSSLKSANEEANIISVKTAKKYKYWLSWFASWIISAVSFFPVSKLDAVFFPNQTAMTQASFFTQPSTNFIMLWAVFNGIVGLILFAIYLKQDVTPEERHAIYTQLKIGRTDFFLTLLLAITVFVLFYSFVFAGEYFFQTDFRFWVLGICTFTSDKLLVLLQYLPFYFIYYLSISMTENYVLCADPAKETRNVILSGLANMLGIFVINAAQYIKLFTTKTALWTDDRLYPMVVLPLIVLLFPAAVINRHLYKATGKIWLSAMINTLILVMIGVANTATLSFL